jgi:hypothetical protein
MQQITPQQLKGSASQICKHYSSKGNDVDLTLLCLGIAVEYLRSIVGNEWSNQTLFGIHSKVKKSNRAGRSFMRAEATEKADKFKWQERTLRSAELIFNLQSIDGIDALVERLRSGVVESTYAELEAGAFLFQRSVEFRFNEPSGNKRSDYDAVILLGDSTQIACEMKAKAESTALSKGAILNPLKSSRGQLPKDIPSVIFLKIPEAWLKASDIWPILKNVIGKFLDETSRVVGVILKWEQQRFIQPDGVVTIYQSQLVRGLKQKTLSDSVDKMLRSLSSRPHASWVSFREIARSALLETRPIKNPCP